MAEWDVVSQEAYAPQGGGNPWDVVSQAPAPDLKDVPGLALKNAPSDAGQMLQGVGQMIAHPLNTAASMAGLVVPEAVSKGQQYVSQKIADQLPEGAAKRWISELGDIQANAPAGMRQYITENYGSWDGFKRAMAEHPVRTATDAMTVMSGGQGALASSMPKTAAAIGAVNPVSLAGKGIDLLRRTPDAAAITRQGLGEAFDVPLSRAQIGGTQKALGAEDQLAHGGRGARAQQIMQDAREQQGTALEDAGQQLRTQLTGAPQPLTPTQIGEQVSGAYREARGAAKQNTTAFYEMAFDPHALATRGIPNAVPLETIAGLPNALEQAFVHDNQYGGALIPTRASTPSTYSAIQMLRRFSQDGSIPSAFPKVTTAPAGATELNWQAIDMVRKQVVGMARGVNPANTTDLAGMRRVLGTFDEHFGSANPLLNQARMKYAQYANAFEPQRNNAAGVNAPLRALQNSNNPGQTIYNTLFEGAPLKRGEAGPLIGKLQDMFQQTPEAMQAVKEGALQRLLNDPKTFEALSPQKVATKVNEALNGPQGEVYRALFSPQELQRLGQYKDLSQLIAQTTKRQNASGSSYPLMRLMSKHRPEVIGAAAGGGIGGAIGGPIGAAIGAPIGGAVGHGVDSLLAANSARRAQIAPNLGQPTPTSSPSMVAGLLAARDAQRRRGLLSP